LLVLASKNNLRIARLGLAVSRKHVRTAVERNKIKRVIRESFRKNQHLLSGLDIVVISQDSLKQEPSQRLRNSLLAHWQRIIHCKNR
jgi:ribonuclease P protein component